MPKVPSLYRSSPAFPIWNASGQVIDENPVVQPCYYGKRPSIIRDRLDASELSQRLVKSGGHVWIPLDVPKHVDGEGLVESLFAQAEDVTAVAYQPLP